MNDVDIFMLFLQTVLQHRHPVENGDFDNPPGPCLKSTMSFGRRHEDGGSSGAKCQIPEDLHGPQVVGRRW